MCCTEYQDHAGRCSFGPQAHVERLLRLPDRIDPDHFNNSSTKPARSPTYLDCFRELDHLRCPANTARHARPAIGF